MWVAVPCIGATEHRARCPDQIWSGLVAYVVVVLKVFFFIFRVYDCSWAGILGLCSCMLAGLGSINFMTGSKASFIKYTIVEKLKHAGVNCFERNFNLFITGGYT